MISGLNIGDTYELRFYSMANAPDNGRNGAGINSTNHLPEFWRVNFGQQTQDGATVYSDDWTTWKQSKMTFDLGQSVAELCAHMDQRDAGPDTDLPESGRHPPERPDPSTRAGTGLDRSDAAGRPRLVWRLRTQAPDWGQAGA